MSKKTPAPNYLNRILVVLGIIFILAMIVFVASAISPNSTNSANQILSTSGDAERLVENNMMTVVDTQKITEPQPNNISPVLGKADAPVTIYEFSSFGCPYSKQIQKIIKETLDKYPQVKLVWKDLPLEDVYPGALLSHRAARCAEQQGKFWQMHDAIWQTTSPLNSALINTLAGTINLDTNKFNDCLKNDATIDTLIKNDVSEANELLISGTPHLYINQQELMGTITKKDLEQIINIEINRLQK